VLALVGPAIQYIPAQSSNTSSSNDSASPDQSKAPSASDATSEGQLSVQARIRARRAQRRAAAIHETYDHLYEAYAGGGYQRFRLPSPLQRANEESWNLGFARYYNSRLGVAVDGSGTYGTAFIEPSENVADPAITHPAIVQYAALIGPTYRFYLQPKYSVSGRVLGGFAFGDFSGDTGGNTGLSTLLHLYPDGYTFAASASILGEYNLSPNIGLRLAPEYLLTGFGSSAQNSLGFTAGIAYRFGKQ